MIGRGIVIVVFVVMGLISAGIVVATQTSTGTPEATGSPDASPGASPDASPGASPGASPAAMVGDIERGKALAAQCLGCHSVDGSTLVGPTWLGLYGRTETLESGETVVVDDAYLHQSIVDPNSQIVAGFPANAMPSYSYLTEEQIADLIAYIKSLQ